MPMAAAARPAPASPKVRLTTMRAGKVSTSAMEAGVPLTRLAQIKPDPTAQINQMPRNRGIETPNPESPGDGSRWSTMLISPRISAPTQANVPTTLF